MPRFVSPLPLVLATTLAVASAVLPFALSAGGPRSKTFTQYECQDGEGHVWPAAGAESRAVRPGVTDETLYIFESDPDDRFDEGDNVLLATHLEYRTASELAAAGPPAGHHLWATCQPAGTFLAECEPELAETSCLK